MANGVTLENINGGTVTLQYSGTGNTNNVITIPEVTSTLVTQTDLDGMGLIPVGTTMFFSANSAPSGFLKANGAAISRTVYSSLFAVIGTTFGAGDGSTTFNLPDLRGEFIRGYDDGRGIDSGRVLGSRQAGAVEAHTHSYTTNGTTYTAQSSGSSTSSVMRVPTTTTTSSYGGTETRPRNIALLACIKY